MKTRLVLLALLAASCAANEPSSGPGRASPTPASTATRDGAATSGPEATGTRPAGVYDDAGAVGSMARAILRSDPARRLVVEIDYVAGRAPSRSAMDHLRRVLAEVAGKPAGITVAAGDEIPSGGGSWTVADLRALERANRAAPSGGDTVRIWVAYLDGSFAEGSSALGVAYAAASAAIFRDRIDDATTAIVNAAGIERAVLTHEAGHLLALVNLGYRSRIDHEDPDHPNHSANDESVMYWAVEDVSLRNLLAGGPPDTFDDADKADLAMLKSSG